MESNPTVPTHRLHEHPAGGHPIVQAHQFQAGIRYLHHIGEVGDEAAHAVATLHAHLHHFLNVFRIVHLLQGLTYRLQGRRNAGGGIVHLVGYHADDLLVRLLLGLHHFGGKTLYQDKRMGESPVDERESRTTVNHGIAQADGISGQTDGRIPGR